MRETGAVDQGHDRHRTYPAIRTDRWMERSATGARFSVAVETAVGAGAVSSAAGTGVTATMTPWSA